MKTSKPTDPSARIACLSYIPLVYSSNAGLFYKSIDVVNVMADSINIGTQLSKAHGCMWVKENNVTPVFVLDRSIEILAHLSVWCEGNISNWFTLDIGFNDTSYVICLHPILERSSSRLAAAYKMRTGRDLTASSIHLIYTPLVFASNSRATFDKYNNQLGNKSMLGIVDSSILNLADPLSLKPTDINFIGPFDVRYNHKDTSELLRQFLAEVSN